MVKSYAKGGESSTKRAPKSKAEGRKGAVKETKHRSRANLQTNLYGRFQSIVKTH